MIKVTSKVNINNMQLKQLERAALTALEKTAEVLHTEVVQAQVVPRRDGALQGEQFFIDYSKSSKGKVSLVHATPYARRMYFHPEYKFHKGPWVDNKGNHDGNPNARGKWYEPWISGKEKDFCRNAFQKLFKRAGDV